MPHLIIAVLIAGAIGLYAGYRLAARRKVDRASRDDAVPPVGEAEEPEKLVWDEESRSYKPRRR